MSALAAYRDDGPLVTSAMRVARSARASDARSRRLAWIVPPLLRILEYSGLIAITALADRDALPLCYAVLGVLAFRHYDTVYRLRHQRVAPPAWLAAVGGGWDGRLLAASALAVAGALDVGLLVAAVGLGVLYVGESTASWLRFVRTDEASSDERDLDDHADLEE